MTSRTVQHSVPRQALRRAFRDSVRECGGQEGVAASATRSFQQQRISDMVHPNCDAWAPLDLIMDIAEVTRGKPGWPHVLREMGRQLGCAVVVLPEQRATPTDIAAAIGLHCREAGEATQRACTALGDGKISAAEAADMLKDWDEAIEAAVATRQLLAQIAETGK